MLAATPATKVLMLMAFDEDEVVDAALRHGVAGFLLESSPPEDLVDAIRHARSGQGALDPAIMPGVIARWTARETDELRLVGLGYNNAEVAAELYLG